MFLHTTIVFVLFTISFWHCVHSASTPKPMDKHEMFIPEVVMDIVDGVLQLHVSSSGLAKHHQGFRVRWKRLSCENLNNFVSCPTVNDQYYLLTKSSRVLIPGVTFNSKYHFEISLDSASHQIKHSIYINTPDCSRPDSTWTLCEDHEEPHRIHKLPQIKDTSAYEKPSNVAIGIAVVLAILLLITVPILACHFKSLKVFMQKASLPSFRSRETTINIESSEGSVTPPERTENQQDAPFDHCSHTKSTSLPNCTPVINTMDIISNKCQHSRPTEVSQSCTLTLI